MDAGTIAIATKMTLTLSVKHFPNNVLVYIFFISVSLICFCKHKRATLKIKKNLIHFHNHPVLNCMRHHICRLLQRLTIETRLIIKC
jgi:hypothetical protein